MTSDLRLSRFEYGFAQFMSVMASAPAKLEEKPKERTHQTRDRSREPHSRSMPFRNEMGSEMVDIYVGPEEEPFRVHKQKLCRRIPYFDKMFNGQFKEASENVGRLPEDDPAAFDVLME
ncbi:hypothetical protein EG329_001447 [Mollisiaceae sp. DMI_Dod_QoI]|nr:hypothetical protein EG329_001447 [Helotiales sp. DMI_Dod_QoI]